MDFIVDTDVLSMLGKIRRITLLKRIFPESTFYMTVETLRELEKAKELGYDYSDDIVRTVKIMEFGSENLSKKRRDCRKQ